MIKILHLENPNVKFANYFGNEELEKLQHEGKTILSVNTAISTNDIIFTTILYDDPFDI